MNSKQFQRRRDRFSVWLNRACFGSNFTHADTLLMTGVICCIASFGGIPALFLKLQGKPWDYLMYTSGRGTAAVNIGFLYEKIALGAFLLTLGLLCIGFSYRDSFLRYSIEHKRR